MPAVKVYKTVTPPKVLTLKITPAPAVPLLLPPLLVEVANPVAHAPPS